jgi:hypothetical protein
VLVLLFGVLVVDAVQSEHDDGDENGNGNACAIYY